MCQQLHLESFLDWSTEVHEATNEYLEELSSGKEFLWFVSLGDSKFFCPFAVI